MDFNLRGKVAIVTGAGGYIGEQIALSLAREGADIAVHDIIMDRVVDDKKDFTIIEGAKKVAEEVRALGCQSMAVKADVTKMAEVDQMVKEVLAKFGKIDILVNAAGGGARGKASLFSESTEEVWKLVVDRNLNGTRNVSRAVINHMLERKSGKIINISSGSGTRGTPGETAYSAAKAGIIGFSMALSKEVALNGIRVNCVCPGPVGHAINPPEMTARDKQGLGRQGKPQEVADLVTFLASDKGDFISGRTYEMGGLEGGLGGWLAVTKK